MRTAYRTCSLCEATCGLAITLDDDDRVTQVRGDGDDVFSRGFLCPKGVSIKQLHEDPDRIRTPLVKQADGSFAEATWDEAFALIAEHLAQTLPGPPLRVVEGAGHLLALEKPELTSEVLTEWLREE